MFERYLSDALTTYFGSIVENLDADKVRLSAWRGELVLHDLQIRQNALNVLMGDDCPVEIAYGKIGKLELKLPWTSLIRWKSDAASKDVECCVILSDLTVLITPKTRRRRRKRARGEDDCDERSVEKQRVEKEHEVQRLLDAQLFERVATSSSGGTEEKKSWARQLVKNLLSNLSVTILNIHVRYEDAGMGFTAATTKREAFAVGITLRQFSIQTTDPVAPEQAESEEEEESGGDEQQKREETVSQEKDDTTVEQKRSQEEILHYSIRHKLAAAYQLAVYWDRGRGCHLMVSNVHNTEDDILQLDSMDSLRSETRMVEQCYFEQAFRVLNGEDSDDFMHWHLYNVEHTYVLSPVSPSMELALVSENTDIVAKQPAEDEVDSTDAESSQLVPPSNLEMSFPPCRLTISASTLEDTAYLRKSLAIWGQTRKSSISEASVRRLTGLRPTTSPLEDPLKWWKYAVEATLILERRDSSHNKHRRHRGWLGLAHAIKMRREYVSLYEKVLCEKDELDREQAHRDLIELEDDLLADEIAAFRLSVYFMITESARSPNAIAQEASGKLTWSEWVRGKKSDASDLEVVESETFSESENVPLEDVGIEQLTLEHRHRMFMEMTDMLQREEANRKRNASVKAVAGSRLSKALNEGPSANDAVWKTCLAFRELSVQVNERVASQRDGYQLQPVIRLSCAVIQRQTISRDESWEVDSAIASLQVVDLTGGASSSSARSFPTLLGSKTGSKLRSEDGRNESVVISGTSLPLSASVSVRRTIERNPADVIRSTDGGDMNVTTTFTTARLMPLEVVYSTNPVAALKRALSTVKTPELTDDYHRMASVMSQWRNRQKGRLLRALAHKQKKIVVDVDIAAPVILIPENPRKDDSPLLVIDLGRLRFSNTDECFEDDAEFDDKWELALDEIQVQCSSTASYRSTRAVTSSKAPSNGDGLPMSSRVQDLIEPFSLHFNITTRIGNQEIDATEVRGTIVNVYATLPRLVFNLTSSAVRLVERLKLQWAERSQMQTKSPLLSRRFQAVQKHSDGASFPKSTASLKSSRAGEFGAISRSIKFRFSAPVIGFRLDNDVDGRGVEELSDPIVGSGQRSRSCPLVDISLRGIGGEFIQAVTSNNDSTSTFDARLRSVTALDLYQKAGDDFALLLSSLPPSLSGELGSILEVTDDHKAESFSSTNDLVSVSHVSTSNVKQLGSLHSNAQYVHLKSSLAITFHELYVEWNPETIAAIHKGMMLPKADDIFNTDDVTSQSESESNTYEVSEVEKEIESDDEFFDAIEATDAIDSTCTKSGGDGDEDDTQMISEISSRVSSRSDLAEQVSPTRMDTGEAPNPSSTFFSPAKTFPIIGSGANPLISPVSPPTVQHHEHTAERPIESNDHSATTKSIEVNFKLSALRVNFNKDSRRRRVLTAEMDDTEVFFSSEQTGRSKTKAIIGNLSFTDPSSATNYTLYKEILGLKSDSFAKSSAKQTSLLEMELYINPRARHVVASDEAFGDQTAATGVSIDCRNGTVRGSDISVSLQLSPMRFVYLQQLWLEIVDYFFEAIIGYEVWGKERPVIHSTPGNVQQCEGSRLQSSGLRSNLPGILAEEFSFTRFEVRMDEPMILLPVSYRSPHFLRLEFNSLIASNYYLGTVATTEKTEVNGDVLAGERAQWFNNCIVELNNLRLTSWEGDEISGFRVQSGSESTSSGATNARIRVNWPTGKWALSIIPKWKVECDIDRMVLSLQRENYALLQHIIVHNIGELSRHVEEWNALQNLPPAELAKYKEEIMVHFGYDKKDTAPTTYDISLKVPSINFVLLGSTKANEDTILEAECTMVEWQMRKLSDRISRQRVLCDITLTKPKGCDGSTEVNAVDLLLPIDDGSISDHAQLNNRGLDARTKTSTRELSYTSTTQPSGNNVKSLCIVNACIFAVYPAWVTVIDFFSNLPLPDFMHPDEVGLAMQIGDRWYRIGSNSSTRPAAASKETSLSASNRDFESATSPSYQFRLLLKSPRIVLSSKPTIGMKNTCAVFRMDHFDFLHHNDPSSRKITKTFFVHDLELHTSSSTVVPRGGYKDENSLIHPWCVSGLYERRDCRLSGICDEQDMRIKADVIQATAAYSDMSVAVDVGLRFLSDFQESQGRSVSTSDASSGTRMERGERREDMLPRKSLTAVELDGFELLVVDDSLRHFAHAQQLIKFSFRELCWYQVGARQDDGIGRRRKRSKLSLHRINVFDCLQPLRSPFRLVATSQLQRNETVSEVEASEMPLSRMSWSDFHSVEDSHWGFRISPAQAKSVETEGLSKFCDEDYFDSPVVAQDDDRAPDLVELHHLFINCVSDEYAVNLRPLTMQWNPSTAIALQRFLGRLRKEATTKFEREWAVPSAASSSTLANLTDSDAVPTRVRFQAHHLTLSLNKEHQHRCLVRVTLSDSKVLFEHDAHGMTVDGSIGNIDAWDTDTYATKSPTTILEENRRILRIVPDVASVQDGQGGANKSPKFLQFRFKTFAGSAKLTPADGLPPWVNSRLVGLGNSRSAIDDYLSISIATLRICYIRERTEEILDYLSNGLPGKGMGATSKAAKGFINKRIQTKSYLEMNVQAPQVYVPQHEKTHRGILVNLGNVEARSWFEEANLSNESGQSVWYRMLSLSLTGICWSANEKNSYSGIDHQVADTVPLDMKIDVKKPTKRGNVVIVRGNLSCIELNLTYTAFVLLKAVIKDNMSREIDVSRWDNVEKAYSLEEEEDHPTYSSDARFIRYGQERLEKAAAKKSLRDSDSKEREEREERQGETLSAPKLDCRFNLDGLRLKLHRNDCLEGLNTLSTRDSGIESSFCYDIVVVRADKIEILASANSAGDKSLQLSLSRLGIYDLGDGGRLARDRYYQALVELDADARANEAKAFRNPCAFSVLVEGYSSLEDDAVDSQERQGHSAEEPQFLVTVDMCTPSSAGLANEDPLSSTEDTSDKIVLARMVFNYLSFNALIRPLREIVDFLTCSWPLQSIDRGISNGVVVSDKVATLDRSFDQFEEHTKPHSSRKGLQLKIVAHYPRIFFLADESDPYSRALVLRGLVVLDTSIVDQETIFDHDLSGSHSWNDELPLGFSDEKIVTTVNAQLHSMETYINPNVENVLGMVHHNPDFFDQNASSPFSSKKDNTNSDDQQLGVALIQPVTAGVEFCQIRRDRFPTLESFSVNMEPVSTILSFEDLTLLEAILERWSPRGTKVNTISTEGSSSHLEDIRLMGTDSRSSFGSEEVTDGELQTVSYDVTFESDRLGLVLKKASGAIIVERMQYLQEAESVQAGDSLMAINGVKIESLSLDEVVELLGSSPRPIKVSFSRNVSCHPSVCLSSSSFGVSRSFSRSQEESDDSVDAVANEGFDGDKHLPDVLTVTLRRGVLNGLTVEPSPCGALPVVIDVLPSFYLNAMSHETRNARLPRTGAVVAEIDGKPSSEIGYLETKELLDKLSSKITDAERLSVAVDSEPTFTVKFLELDSSEWGEIKTADIGIAGVALTFIDDFKGRDMPLLRGKLDGVDIRIERGLGIDPRAVIAAPPDVLELAEKGVDSRDVIAMVRMMVQTEIDYYHPRIAFWEPLLEPSNLCIMVEWQRGSEKRPGQLAVEASDRYTDSSITTEQRQALAAIPQVVSLNLTDAAAEVLVRTIKEWKDWRQRSLPQQEACSPGLDTAESRVAGEYTSHAASDATQSLLPLSPTAQSESTVSSIKKIPQRFDAVEAKDVAAQKAAKAALVFAQKRGAGTKRKSESAKPFVFRNRTGMSLSFMQQEHMHDENRPEEEAKDRPGSPTRGIIPTFLADGCDARFHMDVVSQDQQQKDEIQNAKRVRAYDGQYPSLCVKLEAVPGIVVNPLRNLPVFKVGNTIARLEVRKVTNGNGSDRADGDEFSVPVVWTVEIEDNRRILTLSSAVRVISSGISLSVDVGVYAFIGDDDNGVTMPSDACDIKHVGTAFSGSPFYLPLGLELRCERVDVFVKPSEAEYNWSEESVLAFVPMQSLGRNISGGHSQIDWVWKETFVSSCTVLCEPTRGDNLNSRALWLSLISLPHVESTIRKNSIRQLKRNPSTREGKGALISIAVDSGLTLRNLLPANLQWEIAAFQGPDEMVTLDSSSVREQPAGSHLPLRKGYGLGSGEGVDVLSFSPGLMDTRARFRCCFGQEWSQWAQLVPHTGDSKLDHPQKTSNEGLNESGGTRKHSTRQVNVQIQDEFGVPLTIGVRVVPKMARADNQEIGQCIGLDAIIFAELWLRNLTPLPLAFGCPSSQINKACDHANGLSSEFSSDEAGVINAESALIELASILEFGDKGKGVNLRDNNASIVASNTYLLPYQTADLMFEEVFEYVEVENSEVKRKWWASERHDSRRRDPKLFKGAENGWYWIDDEWKIDCSGQSIRSSGGWESCRSLIGGKDDYFSRRRMFNPTHPFRRRRWFRRRRASSYRYVSEADELLPGQLFGSINAFHQPVDDAFTRAQEKRWEMQKKKERSADDADGRDVLLARVDECVTKICIRCGDGQWSAPCLVPQTGGVHGIIRVPASRWPTLTKLSRQQAEELPEKLSVDGSSDLSPFDGEFAPANLSPALYELCYKVQDLGEDWGELTRIFLLTPRFMLRNDSQVLVIEVKQSGAPDEKAVTLKPGEVAPFFWADFRLPELVSVRPVLDNREGIRRFRWSGGFDVSTLGMTAIRVRRSWLSAVPRKTESSSLKSIRTLVEIRPGTGGTGINVSFKEENPSGIGSLFRIENLSPFLIWIAQDGVLANPSALLDERRSRVKQEGQSNAGLLERRILDDHSRTDGDLIEPGDCTAFALDVPFRQGKYAGRKAASMSELTRLRVGLAPLSSRDGVESTKVVSLSSVGDSVRLSPAKLSSISGFDIRTHLVDLRVLGVVTTDGPTRVLRFCMMRKNDSSGVFDYTLSNIASSGPFRNPIGSGLKISSRGKEEYLQQVTLDSAMRAIEMDAPKENEAIRLAFFGSTANGEDIQASSHSVSLVDKVPSEIALVTLKDVEVSTNWNKKRTTDGTALVSVGWLQVDNFVPSAPFPVAVCPVRQDTEQLKTVDETGEGSGIDDDEGSSPLLLVGLTFAPKHKSGILCLRSATIAPRDLAVSVDLAFVVRLQQFFVGILRHFRSAFAKGNMADKTKASMLLLQSETRQSIPFPDIESMVQQLEGARVGVGSQKLYFEGLSILPCNINLSVAPARALTSSQASLEGSEAAALHTAIRKGDLLVGGGMLGVNIGHKNQTAVSVVRGVFKSIIVDALLRCESACLNFSGVYLQNHISTGPQLKTFLGAHYMESLKSNVPALLGSMAALGNPLGLIRGIGDGMSDFVNEPVKGLQRSMEEMDPSYVVGGVARGTKSLARHAVGGFAGSASLLTETFSKNMAVITLDRRYAQRRDRRNTLRSPDRDFAVTFFEGVESGAVKLMRGVWDGVSGVVRAPLRGAERHGMEGFAKGVGKGLLGLLVKPVIGLSDAATDVMIGVQGSVEGKKGFRRGSRQAQVRPRRPMYGRDRILRPYSVTDAAAATLMLRTRLAGENYLSHYDMEDKVALLSVKRAILLGPDGRELLMVKYKNIEKVKVEPMAQQGNGSEEWAVVIVLSVPQRKERPVHVIGCKSKAIAIELCSQLNRGVSLVNES